MKKKGLIISTVVMVVVLIASLTTATYAWFSSASFTTITGFGLEVSPSNAVSIGVKINNTYNATATVNDFMSGNVTYEGTANGGLAGQWTGGEDSLGASLTHNITWGEITSAVGWTSASIEDNKVEAADQDNTGLLKDGKGDVIVAANKGATAGTLANQTPAVVNNGDLAYLFLGVSPNGALKANTNVVYVVVQMVTGGNENSAIGIAAAIHVAWRLNSNGAWTEKDVFTECKNDGVTKTSYAAKWREIGSYTIEGFSISNEAKTAAGVVATTDGSDTTLTNAVVCAIPLTAYEAGLIDQLELVIYVAGADDDCIDAATSGAAHIAIIFGAQLDD